MVRLANKVPQVHLEFQELRAQVAQGDLMVDEDHLEHLVCLDPRAQKVE